MDSFMDKLAQKLTAQEMIKANSAADAEEMKKLKSQMKEYRDILDQMQKLITDSAEKIENAKVDGSEINRLVDESIAKINQLQQSVDENVHKECVKVYRNVQAVVVEENGKQTESVVAAVKELKRKFVPILGVSLTALIVSIAGIVFQVLVYLHVI